MTVSRRASNAAQSSAAQWARKSAAQSSAVQWARSSAALAALRVHVDAAGTIEDAHGLIQVDFANR